MNLQNKNANVACLLQLQRTGLYWVLVSMDGDYDSTVSVNEAAIDA